MKKQFNPFITVTEVTSEKPYLEYVCKADEPSKTPGPYQYNCEYYKKPGLFSGGACERPAPLDPHNP